MQPFPPDIDVGGGAGSCAAQGQKGVAPIHSARVEIPFPEAVTREFDHQPQQGLAAGPAFGRFPEILPGLGLAEFPDEGRHQSRKVVLADEVGRPLPHQLGGAVFTHGPRYDDHRDVHPATGDR